MIMAVAILMLHMVLPHEHHSKMEGSVHQLEHKEARSLLDFFRLAFHLEEGDGNLEKIQLNGKLQLSFNSLAQLIINFEPKLVEIAPHPFHVFQEKPLSNHFISSIRFRGPPTAA